MQEKHQVVRPRCPDCDQNLNRRDFLTTVGGAALAAGTGHPVVPVAHNAGHYWPRRGFLKRPGTIQVVIGPVIESHGKTAVEINSLAESWIRTTMARLEAESAGPS